MASAPLYKPFIKVTTRQYPFLALVSQADPSFQRVKHWDIAYEMGNKVYYNNPLTSGPYSRLSNTYAVGQPQGAPDPLITAALAPTVGVPTPGLFSGTPDGKGWA
jgi:hypothetical protein